MKLDSQGEVLLNGVRYKHNPYSFFWHADSISFLIELREAGVVRPSVSWQEWRISRDTGAAKAVLHSRTTAYSAYACRDSVTGQTRF